MILVALGANLPDADGRAPRQTVQAALAALGAEPGIRVTAISRLWETAPVPVSDQPWFVNAVAAVETGLPPADLLARLHAIEARFGRVRVMRWEARVLDLDLIAYDDLVTGTDQMTELVIPHPRMAERAFVLLPLADIAPGWRHPVTGAALGALIAALDPAQVGRPVAG